MTGCRSGWSPPPARTRSRGDLGCCRETRTVRCPSVRECPLSRLSFSLEIRRSRWLVFLVTRRQGSPAGLHLATFLASRNLDRIPLTRGLVGYRLLSRTGKRTSRTSTPSRGRAARVSSLVLATQLGGASRGPAGFPISCRDRESTQRCASVLSLEERCAPRCAPDVHSRHIRHA
jgi:hypothetical protein